MTDLADVDLTDLEPDADELADLARGFERAEPTEILRWVTGRFGENVILASSFENAVLIDLAVSVKPDIEVLFLDTQYHFAETLWFVEEVRRRYRLNLRVEKPLVQPDNRWQQDVNDCCRLRKVEPLTRALAGRRAWITGLRRDDGPSRATAPIVAWDPARRLVKVNPLATWTALDVASYEATHGLPVNPLVDRGYPSIGCWPCTKPVADGEDPRSGRWAGLGKTECGLHL